MVVQIGIMNVHQTQEIRPVPICLMAIAKVRENIETNQNRKYGDVTYQIDVTVEETSLENPQTAHEV